MKHRTPDQQAWLDENPYDIEYIIGHPEGLSEKDYWEAIMGTLAWQGFILRRRMSDLVDAVLGR